MGATSEHRTSPVGLRGWLAARRSRKAARPATHDRSPQPPVGDGPPPLVFLSHSGFDGDDKILLETIADALRDAGFMPALDREALLPGIDFNPRVDNMIAVCHATVVLMNRRAFKRESTWVYNEVSRLQARELFQLVPLYSDGISAADLLTDEAWRLTGLAGRDPVYVADTPAATAQRVVEALDETRRRAAAGVVEREIARLLGEKINDVVLKAAAPRLALEWISGDAFHWTARQLVTATDFDRVRDFLQELSKTDLETATTVLRLVMPFMWVKPEAVKPIPAAIAEGWPVCINTDSPQTTRAYVHCASTRWPLWKVLEAGAGFDGEYVEGLVHDARKGLAYAEGDAGFRPRGRSRPRSAAADSRPLVILAVTCPAFSAEILDRVEAFITLQRRVGVIFQGGDVPWDVLPAAVRERIVYLRPELERELETEAHRGLAAELKILSSFHARHLESLQGQ